MEARDKHLNERIGLVLLIDLISTVGTHTSLFTLREKRLEKNPRRRKSPLLSRRCLKVEGNMDLLTIDSYSFSSWTRICERGS
jgi:hypothetical protein